MTYGVQTCPYHGVYAPFPSVNWVECGSSFTIESDDVGSNIFVSAHLTSHVSIATEYYGVSDDFYYAMEHVASWAYLSQDGVALSDAYSLGKQCRVAVILQERSHGESAQQ